MEALLGPASPDQHADDSFAGTPPGVGGSAFSVIFSNDGSLPAEAEADEMEIAVHEEEEDEWAGTRPLDHSDMAVSGIMVFTED